MSHTGNMHKKSHLCIVQLPSDPPLHLSVLQKMKSLCTEIHDVIYIPNSSDDSDLHTRFDVLLKRERFGANGNQN